MKYLIFSHRGLHGGGIPENSLAAFRLALESDCGIELDVRLSKDGVPVVFHDKTLKRMCGDSRKVSALSFVELRQLRLDGTDERIPSLEEVMELVGGRQPLLIETKLPKRFPASHRLERKLIPILMRYSGEFLLQSFNRYSMRFMKRKLPHAACGILSGELYPEPHGFDFINYRLSGLSPEKMTELRKYYSRVFAWSTLGFDKVKCLKAFETLGLDGIVI